MCVAALAALVAAPAGAHADPSWWAVDAGLSRPPAAAVAPAGGDLADGLAHWLLLGPGRVSVRTGGPAGRYAAVRDNTTLVSAPFSVPASAQVLTLVARSLRGRETVTVRARRDGVPDLELGTIVPGRVFGTHALSARAVAGRHVRLVLDPVLAFGDGIDLARLQAEQVAPTLVLARGAARRVAGGPAGRTLLAESGPLELVQPALRIPADAVTVSIWARRIGLPAAAPLLSFDAGAAHTTRRLAPGRFAPLRIAAGALRGRTVVLRVNAADGRGLQIAWIGTVQRAASLRFVRLRREGRVVQIRARASQALARVQVVLELQRGGRWIALARPGVRVDGLIRARIRLPAGAGRPRLRLVWRGSEGVAPGVSPARRVPRVQPPALPP